MKKVVLAGGTGFIGQYFQQSFEQLGYYVFIISRQQGHISWEDRTGIGHALDGAELLINLAGKSVNCRYNDSNKKEITESRTRTTRILGEAVLQCSKPPALWINASTATIYRHAEDKPMTEQSGELGTGFSVEVAKAWEEAFFSYELPHTRQAALRIAIVLGPGGGVLTPYIYLTRFGLGGKQGPGNQKFSFIHVEDLFRIVQYIQSREDLIGVFNASAPYPVTNRELMHEMRKTLGVPVGIPTPKWMLEMGAIVIRTETELVLKSRWVVPERILEEGFEFKYPTIQSTLKAVLDI
ncbi:TIGR01777 family oxidoreductase [Paenibacillus urinalis]|uniref:TIGR01777 family oxidoreductase n=1 Tax=Paenibacillus urinalis TaxID=521520 RepID=A0ABY7XIC5_9BACL|nr:MULTISPECIES: TIGR01777 family oxidoreductase [Paenibacillus]WDH96393.1 TIGR01777 family oxidoreductase [Paenibacillus urinalis]WDI04615.1 TIGR01777 family oxidoreductase [Paenibacillus urinalis]GAK40520.1 NAD-dependent epimerase/dehydratase [Paenibacillus sp. TCA20]